MSKPYKIHLPDRVLPGQEDYLNRFVRNYARCSEYVWTTNISETKFLESAVEDRCRRCQERYERVGGK